jgi:small subunit ribosomal protein S6
LRRLANAYCGRQARARAGASRRPFFDLGRRRRHSKELVIVAFYESVYIARPDITSAQVEALTQALGNIVTENGGAVKKSEYWGLKTLSFRIKKNRKGHYSMMNIDAPAAAIRELERNMRINEDVLRYLTVRVETLEEGPSAMMQRRDERDRDRGDRGGRFDRDRDRDRGDRDRGDRDRDRPRREMADRGERSEAGGNGESRTGVTRSRAPSAGGDE